MLSLIKKLAAAALAMTVFCSCAGETVTSPGSSKYPAQNVSPQKAESSVFGRNISYNAYSPAEDLSLPIPTDDILSMAQLEKTLYFLGGGAVYYLDTESGTSEKLFDTSADMFAVKDDKIYTYSSESSELTEYDGSGGAINELTVKIADVDSVSDFLVTDDCYVFYCTIPGAMMMEPHLFVYSRENDEFILSKKISATKIYPYRENKVFVLTVDQVFTGLTLGSFDAKTGKTESFQNVGNTSDVGYRPGVVYCPKTDTALVYGIREIVDDGSPCCITEYSLKDDDNIVLDRYYLDVSFDTRFFLGIYENAVFAISSADNECRVFDYLDPPESITVLGYDVLADIVYSFEQETGVLVKNASTDRDKLTVKLMAGDDDFDIYYPGGAYYNYVDAGVYVDLSGIESLRQKISQVPAVELAVSYDGKYFGVPTSVYNYFTEEYYGEDGTATPYSQVITENIYYAQNVDAAEKIYSDQDGEELYKLFKYLNDYPEGNRKKMPFGDSVEIYTAVVYMLNPKSQNHDNAIKFLEYLFDSYSGAIPGAVPEDEQYPKLKSTENCYAEWRCRPTEILQPIMLARNAIIGKKGQMSGGELKKLAKETAAEVAMRIGE